MSQSNLIFGALFFAFVIFITVRGELPAYLSALIGTNAAPARSNGQASAGASAGGIAAQAGGAVNQAIGSSLAGSIAGQAVSSAIGGLF